jgi:arylsulfatase A-like enzyme
MLMSPVPLHKWTLWFLTCLLGLPVSKGSLNAAEVERPHVLFISVDDLNDWIGCLGGHPQVKTPHLDALARRGVLFTNAHCAAPLCSPSRAAVFSGIHPWQTGVLENEDNILRKQPELVHLPQYFASQGYRTLGTGKLLHSNSKAIVQEGFFPEQRWSPFDPQRVKYTDENLPTKGTDPRHAVTYGRQQRAAVLPFNGMPSDRAPQDKGGESFDWGPVDVSDSEMGDGQITDWAIQRLGEKHSTPFFLAVGYYRPHIPLYAPRQYFELYDDMEVTLPPFLADDLHDLSPTGRTRALEAVTAGAHETVLKYDQWQAAVKGYLACISFVDAQVGRLLAALDSSPYQDRTVIVLWGDHGWHLGEKQHWGKWTGWQRSTAVPLIIVPPGQSTTVGNTTRACDEAVSLLDLYPTLIDLCHLPARTDLSGTSLVPWLNDPQRFEDRTVVTTFGEGNHALSGQDWRYIRYADGSEELYDRKRDRHEWKNLASDPRFEADRHRMRIRLEQQSGAIP